MTGLVYLRVPKALGLIRFEVPRRRRRGRESHRWRTTSLRWRHGRADAMAATNSDALLQLLADVQRQKTEAQERHAAEIAAKDAELARLRAEVAELRAEADNCISAHADARQMLFSWGRQKEQ